MCPLMRPTPATRPSAGLRVSRSSSARRWRCAATISGPYSTNVPGSIRSSTFSRAVRWLVLRRRLTASGRFSSRVRARRASTSARSGRMAIEVELLRAAHGLAATSDGSSSDQQLVLPRGYRRARREWPGRRRRRFRRDDVLHLHGFHHGKLGPRRNGVTDRDGNRDDRALHRRPDRDHPVRQIPHSAAAGWLASADVPRLAVGEHGQRIDGVDLGTGSGPGLLPGSLEVEMRALLAGARGKRGSIRLDEVGLDGPGAHVLVRQQRLQKGDVGRGARDVEFAERPVALGQSRPRAGRCGRKRSAWRATNRRPGWCVADIATAVDANTATGRWLERASACHRPAWPCRRVACVSRLMRAASPCRAAPVPRRAQAPSSASVAPPASRSCSSTRSRPGDLLRHRVLDLQARVRLDEIEVPPLAPSTRNSNGAEAAVVRGARERQCGVEQPLDARSAPGSAPERSRRASGGGAGASSRAPTGAPPPARRRSPAPRCGAPCRMSCST